MFEILRRCRMAAALFLCLSAIVLMAIPAMAGDGTIVDWAPLIQIGVEILVGVAVIIVPVLVHRVYAFLGKALGIKISDQNRAVIDQAIARGIGFAQHALNVRLSAGMPFDVRNKVIAAAVTYALPKIPDAMAHFNITEDGLAQRIAGELMKQIGPDPLAPTSIPTATAAQTSTPGGAGVAKVVGALLFALCLVGGLSACQHTLTPAEITLNACDGINTARDTLTPLRAAGKLSAGTINVVNQVTAGTDPICSGAAPDLDESVSSAVVTGGQAILQAIIHSMGNT